MTKQTTQAAGFRKKPYAKPQIHVFEVKPTNIFCTSGSIEKMTEEDANLWF